MRNSAGPMKHRNTPKGGASNQHDDILAEAEAEWGEESEMSMLEFSDGEKFDLDGEYRIERRSDGLYVLGNGLMSPVESEEEGNELIKRLSGKRVDVDPNADNADA